MTTDPSSARVFRPGGWLPEQQDELEDWIAGHRERVEALGEDVPLHPVIVVFQELIARDPVVRLYMTEMIEQVPGNPSRTASDTSRASTRCSGKLTRSSRWPRNSAKAAWSPRP